MKGIELFGIRKHNPDVTYDNVPDDIFEVYKGEKFAKIKGHKYEIKLGAVRFAIIVTGLIGVFSRNIHKGDVFEDENKNVSKSVLSI